MNARFEDLIFFSSFSSLLSVFLKLVFCNRWRPSFRMNGGCQRTDTEWGWKRPSKVLLLYRRHFPPAFGNVCFNSMEPQPRYFWPVEHHHSAQKVSWYQLVQNSCEQNLTRPAYRQPATEDTIPPGERGVGGAPQCTRAHFHNIQAGVSVYT